MQKLLNLINEEVEKDYDGAGRLVSSKEKQYFDYVCHDATAECQLRPVLCRIVDKLNPDDEPAWESNEKGCEQCFGVNDRALEELYSRRA